MFNLAAALILITVLCLLRLPALELFSSHLLGGNGPDTYLYFWLVNTFPKNFLEYGWFETNSFYPYRDTLAFSDSFLPPTLIYYVFKQIGLSEIQSWNLLFMLANFLNGFCVLLLGREAGLKKVPALIVSLIFISSSYFTEHLGHPQLQFFFFIPLIVGIFLKLLKTPCLKLSMALSTMIALAFCTSVYNAICACLACFLYYFFCILKEKRLDLYQLRFLLTSALITLVILLPVLIPYLRIKELFGARGFHEFYNFAFSAGSFFNASPLSSYYSGLNFSHSEAGFFWGVACLTLLFICIVQIYRADKALCVALIGSLLFSEKLLFSFLGRETRLIFCAIFCWITVIRLISVVYKKNLPACTAAGIMVLLVALGPLGYKEINVAAAGPFTFFYYLFPGVDSLRAISRLGAAAILLLIVGNSAYLNRLNLKLLVLLPVLFIDSATTAIPLAPLAPKPQIFEELNHHYNKGDAVLVTPLSGMLDKNRNIQSWSEVAALNSQYLVDLRESAPKLLNGYSGQRPKSLYTLPKIMARFPDQKSLQLLSEYKDLKWIVVLGSRIDGFSAEDFIYRIAELSDKIIIVSQKDTDFLLELK